MVRVKLCGLMGEQDVDMAVAAGADALGFVTEYPVPVPWNLDRDRSAELVRYASPFVTTVAVVGGPVERMVDIALVVRPQVLQLHGDETVDMVREVCGALAGTGIKVIKALRIDVDTGEVRFDSSDPREAAGILTGSGIAALVIDSKTSTRPAGTGVTLDWEAVTGIREAIDLPLILAGGLNAGNVTDAITVVRPYAVDVISGVESERGVKDADKMCEFVKAAKGWKKPDIA